MHIGEKEEKEIPLCSEEKGILQDFSVYTSLCLSLLALCMPCLVLLCSLTHTNGSYQMCTCGIITPINNMTATPTLGEELLVFSSGVCQ